MTKILKEKIEEIKSQEENPYFKSLYKYIEFSNQEGKEKTFKKKIRIELRKRLEEIEYQIERIYLETNIRNNLTMQQYLIEDNDEINKQIENIKETIRTLDDEEKFEELVNKIYKETEDRLKDPIEKYQEELTEKNRIEQSLEESGQQESQEHKITEIDFNYNIRQNNKNDEQRKIKDEYNELMKICKSILKDIKYKNVPLVEKKQNQIIPEFNDETIKDLLEFIGEEGLNAYKKIEKIEKEKENLISEQTDLKFEIENSEEIVVSHINSELNKKIKKYEKDILEELNKKENKKLKEQLRAINIVEDYQKREKINININRMDDIFNYDIPKHIYEYLNIFSSLSKIKEIINEKYNLEKNNSEIENNDKIKEIIETKVEELNKIISIDFDALYKIEDRINKIIDQYRTLKGKKYTEIELEKNNKIRKIKELKTDRIKKLENDTTTNIEGIERMSPKDYLSVRDALLIINTLSAIEKDKTQALQIFEDMEISQPSSFEENIIRNAVIDITKEILGKNAISSIIIKTENNELTDERIDFLKATAFMNNRYTKNILLNLKQNEPEKKQELMKIYELSQKMIIFACTKIIIESTTKRLEMIEYNNLIKERKKIEKENEKTFSSIFELSNVEAQNQLGDINSRLEIIKQINLKEIIETIIEQITKDKPKYDYIQKEKRRMIEEYYNNLLSSRIGKLTYKGIKCIELLDNNKTKINYNVINDLFDEIRKIDLSLIPTIKKEYESTMIDYMKKDSKDIIKYRLKELYNKKKQQIEKEIIKTLNNLPKYKKYTKESIINYTALNNKIKKELSKKSLKNLIFKNEKDNKLKLSELIDERKKCIDKIEKINTNGFEMTEYNKIACNKTQVFIELDEIEKRINETSMHELSIISDEQFINSNAKKISKELEKIKPAKTYDKTKIQEPIEQIKQLSKNINMSFEETLKFLSNDKNTFASIYVCKNTEEIINNLNPNDAREIIRTIDCKSAITGKVEMFAQNTLKTRLTLKEYEHKNEEYNSTSPKMQNIKKLKRKLP
jgi:hypothetical protein